MTSRAVRRGVRVSDEEEIEWIQENIVRGRGNSDAERTTDKCMCCWSPARPVCPNHELVEFHPQIVTDLDLGAGANAYTISNPPPHLFQPCSG